MVSWSKAVLAATFVITSAVPSYALSWICDVPEIDGPAGISAVALLVSIGMVAYDRARR